jgi:hypothetical protein
VAEQNRGVGGIVERQRGYRSFETDAGLSENERRTLVISRRDRGIRVDQSGRISR